MTRAKDISKIVTDADLSGTLDVAGTVTAGGNVGINESNPSSSLHIYGSTPKITLEHSNENGTAQIYTQSQSGIILDADPDNTDNGTPIQLKTDGKARLLVEDSGDISFYEDTGTTPKLFWDSSEETLNLNLASTLNNNFRLNIKGNSGNGGIVHSPNTDAATVPVLRMLNAAVSANVAELGTASGSDFYVSTGGTERMRIDSNGSLLLGTTDEIIWTDASGEGIVLYRGKSFQVARNSDSCVLLNRQGTDGQIQAFAKSGTQVGNISVTGSSTAYNTSSDHRLKENVTADWDATTRLKQLNPVRFNFIADADTTVDGFLAHEVQSVVPEAITGTHNEVDADGNPVYQGIDQSKLVPLLVKTIQELEARITALESN